MNGVRLDGDQAAFSQAVSSNVGKPTKFTIFNCKTNKYRGLACSSSIHFPFLLSFASFYPFSFHPFGFCFPLLISFVLSLSDVMPSSSLFLSLQMSPLFLDSGVVKKMDSWVSSFAFLASQKLMSNACMFWMSFLALLHLKLAWSHLYDAFTHFFS